MWRGCGYPASPRLSPKAPPCTSYDDCYCSSRSPRRSSRHMQARILGIQSGAATTWTAIGLTWSTDFRMAPFCSRAAHSSCGCHDPFRSRLVLMGSRISVCLTAAGASKRDACSSLQSRDKYYRSPQTTRAFSGCPWSNSTSICQRRLCCGARVGTWHRLTVLTGHRAERIGTDVAELAHGLWTGAGGVALGWIKSA